MLENALFELVRSTLLASLATAPGYADVGVKRMFQPLTVGVPSAPTIFMQNIGERRIGWVRREEVVPVPPATEFTHNELQWWETTFQVNAFARRDPTKPDFMTLPSAMDIAKMASDILQSDKGLAALKVQRVRPLRITAVRNVPFVNDSDQYEQNPSFDIVLSHVQIISSTTPPVAEIVPVVGRV